ncbi:MAG: YraN family protein [Chloroflexota bacterium]|nr:YraN family protein [Chloroflexota bacterium]
MPAGDDVPPARDPASQDPVPQDIGRIDVGRIGERIARHHLQGKGYRIVDANYQCQWGEVDLIARDGPVWVFVEVRARRSAAYGSPEESVTPAKARRLTLTAQDFLRRRVADSSNLQWRIDLVAIRLGPNRRVLSVNHLENIVEE